MRRSWCVATLLLFPIHPELGGAAESESGRGLLEKNCGRCHALAAGKSSPLSQAPNLWIVLRTYPSDRLEFELSEGIGSRHKDMPQIQFSSEQIQEIQDYLSGN